MGAKAKTTWAEWMACEIAGLGAILIAGAVFDFAVNRDMVPSIWSGFIYEVLLVGAAGVALVVYGSVQYNRVRRARTR